MRRIVIPLLLVALIMGCASKTATTTPHPATTVEKKSINEIINNIKNKYETIKTLEGNLTVYINNQPTVLKFWFKNHTSIEKKQQT